PPAPPPSSTLSLHDALPIFLLAVLLAYPLVIAGLVGLVAGYANSKPRVALVDEDNLPPVIVLGGHRFHVDWTIARVSHDVKLVRDRKSTRLNSSHLGISYAV